ncbi:MAG: DUF402 domain-containing protein [Xenococcaceae cyanobacterium]
MRKIFVSCLLCCLIALLISPGQAFAGQGFYININSPSNNLDLSDFQMGNITYHDWYLNDIQNGKLGDHPAPYDSKIYQYYTENCAGRFDSECPTGNAQLVGHGLIFSLLNENSIAVNFCLSQGDLSPTAAPQCQPGSNSYSSSTLGKWTGICIIPKGGYKCEITTGDGDQITVNFAVSLPN